MVSQSPFAEGGTVAIVGNVVDGFTAFADLSSGLNFGPGFS